MARADRLQVTVTVEMTIALDFLAARTGHTRAAQATLMLRQALDRTIKSAAVQEHMRKGEISGTLNSSEFAARIAKDVAYWRPMLPKLGIAAQGEAVPAAVPSAAPAAPSR